MSLNDYDFYVDSSLIPAHFAYFNKVILFSDHTFQPCHAQRVMFQASLLHIFHLKKDKSPVVCSREASNFDKEDSDANETQVSFKTKGTSWASGLHSVDHWPSGSPLI